MENTFQKIDYVQQYKIKLDSIVESYQMAINRLNSENHAFNSLVDFVKNNLVITETGLKTFEGDSIGALLNKVYKNRCENFKEIKNIDHYSQFLQWLVDSIKKTDLEYNAESVVDLLLSLPRVSDDNQGFTYYPSFEKMTQERPTKTTIGKALNFFGFNPEIARIVSESYTRLITEEKQQLFFLENPKDPQQWIDVYATDNGFVSCMNGMDCVRVYAHPENTLTLAYLTENNKPNGITIARCICCTKTKTISRLYGLQDNKVKLAAMLEGAGFNPIETYNKGNETLEGQPLVFESDDYESTLVMPYIDGHHCLEIDTDNKTVIINSSGDYMADDTDGIVSINKGAYCPCCNSHGHDEDYMYWVESEGQSVCQSCIEHHYSYCEICNEYVDNDSVVEYINSRGRSGNYASIYALKNHGEFVRLDREHHGIEWSHIDSAVYTHDDEWIAHNDSVMLDDEFYPENPYCHEDDEYIEAHNGENILECDAEEFEGEWYHTDSDELKALKEAAEELAEKTEETN